MSLNALFNTNLKTPWNNIRVNNLVVDGEISASSSTNVVVNGQVSGSLPIAPLPVQFVFAKVGNMVTMKMPNFSVINANQNPNGTIVLLCNIPVGYRPGENCNFQMFFTNSSGNIQYIKLQWIESANELVLNNPLLTNNFVQGSGDFSTQHVQYINYLV